MGALAKGWRIRERAGIEATTLAIDPVMSRTTGSGPRVPPAGEGGVRAEESRATAVVAEDPTVRLREVALGRNVRFFGFANLYGCSIGDDTKIGPFVEVQKGATIGRRCKISSHSFVCEGVHIGDDVFVGHGVMFTNDKYPRASIGGRLVTDEWTCVETFVEDGVSIGSNATIICGVRIGSGALIGAGAVLTRDVPPGAVVAGVPARTLTHRAAGAGSQRR
jgi:acetyltransferase-like isoleucine patch superfamily enzyme